MKTLQHIGQPVVIQSKDSGRFAICQHKLRSRKSLTNAKLAAEQVCQTDYGRNTLLIMIIRVACVECMMLGYSSNLHLR